MVAKMRFLKNIAVASLQNASQGKNLLAWPLLAGTAARWAVRAAIDAEVAHAYGLTRGQYTHVPSTFSHSSYKDAPRQCLAGFDELQSLGLAAFTQKHDPYWNIPLNVNLPQPVTIGVNSEPRTVNGGPAVDRSPLAVHRSQQELDFQTAPPLPAAACCSPSSRW